ncbi:ABC transporter substrate-binding protein [Bradyrhizobium sp. ISRA443]|uniref:ABC transporter substrate-binding protein n=1 Tax=unclassified Bradyrhizobium TaxID=2631580 RepID=UPI00247AFF0D|nr:MULTISPECIES: ABC transporter substrate-binding protein [unclassified Bradyrhizobium]WGR95641.1 ABC transporter substrate-binding protein [Bradyrhizobium sp. ISRA435]WGS00713.1 ABC transporter substrate-binding protein [Bradyrhizobium sp. ISRA436]WGS07600.1 ABC transporter substrate-binding protein [Bradyrhizobium sp. ISRA437]WGS14488.1 ABC transporter substrate-binding protein [Bradyrhizobium sp. ISRA443]
MKLALAALWIFAGSVLMAPDANADIKVGIVVSASGPGSALGQPQMRTIAALPKEIDGEKVVYIALDDESDPTKGTQNARRLVIQDGVDILIGSSLTPVTMPMLDVALESRTPIISLAAATAIVQPIDDRRRWAFKVVPNDDLMAGAILKHIAKSGIKTLGYIGVSDGYGEGYYKEISRLAPTLGLTVTTHEVYARADTSATGQALKVIATNPEAVFIASAGTPAVLPQEALRGRGYAGKIFQTHGVASEEFIKLGGANVEGAVFTGEAFTIADDLPANDPFRQVRDAFVSSYEKVNGQKPNIFGAHLWDAIALLKRAVPNALKVAKPGTPEFRAALRDELERGKDVYLNNGLSTMSATDHNGYDERSAFLIKVEGGKFRLMK